MGGCGLDSSGLGCGPLMGSFVHDNAISGSIKGGEFFE